MIGSAVWVVGIAAARAEAPPLGNLPAAEQKSYAIEMENAQQEHKARQYDHALEHLAKAEAIFADAADLHNLRGACLVEKRQFAGALESFRKADALMPGNPSVSFNMAEIHFVEHRWDEAAKAFGDLQPKLIGGDETLAALVDLKLLVCHCKLGALEEAEALAEKHAKQPATPFPWYAKAVIEFENKNRAAAAGFLVDVKEVHPDPKVNALFRDALIESHYVKN